MTINVVTDNIERYVNSNTKNFTIKFHDRMEYDFERLHGMEPSNILCEFIRANKFSDDSKCIFTDAYLEELKIRGKSSVRLLKDYKEQVNIFVPVVNGFDISGIIVDFLNSEGVCAIAQKY